MTASDGMGKNVRSDHPDMASVGRCLDCGKKCYLSRKAARRAAATTHPGAPLSVYKCGVYFHYGHTPERVKKGLAPRRSG